MGRILVFYHSNTNCTKAMGDLIAAGARGLPGNEVRLRSCADCSHSDVLWCDALAVGTPTNLGGIAWEMKKWWDDFAADHWDKVDGKLCTTFSSQGGHGGGAELTCMAMATVLLNFGFLFFGVTDYVDKIHTLHYGAVVTKAPRNDFDVASCHRLGLRMAEWVAVYVDGRKALHPQLTTKAADRAATAPIPGLPEEVPRPVHLVIQKEVPAESQTEWLELAAEMSQHSWAEDGCIRYEFVRGSESPTRFYILETWASQRHLDAHAASAHFQRIVPAMDGISETTAFNSCETALDARPAQAACSMVAPTPKKVLIFTKATDYHHGSLPSAAACIHTMCLARGWITTVSDDEALLETPKAAEGEDAASEAADPETFDVIVFVNNSGELFDTSRESLSAHVAAGRGVLGVHAALASFLVGEDASGATEMEYSSPIFEEVFGAHFKNHPPPQNGSVSVDRATAAGLGISFGSLPSKFEHHDEFFNYSQNPTGVEGLQVLATVDEASYEGGTMGETHPVVWARTLGENDARVFYTALGHFSHFYNGRGPSTVAKIIEAGLDYVAKGL